MTMTPMAGITNALVKIMSMFFVKKLVTAAAVIMTRTPMYFPRMPRRYTSTTIKKVSAYRNMLYALYLNEYAFLRKTGMPIVVYIRKIINK
jgi:hypothetical protein